MYMYMYMTAYLPCMFFFFFALNHTILLPLTPFVSKGYRHIKLHTTEWEVIEGATIFVEVRIEDYVGPTPRSKVDMSKHAFTYMYMHIWYGTRLID